MIFCLFFNLFCHLKIHVFFVLTLLPFTYHMVLNFIDSSIRHETPSLLLTHVNTAAAASPWRSTVSPPSLPHASDLPSMEGEPPAEDITARTIAMDVDATSRPAALALGASGPAAQAAAAPGAHPDVVPGEQATVDHLPQSPLENRSDDATALARVLLPTVHHPITELNLPVLDVQRYCL